MVAVTHGHQAFVSRLRQHCDFSAQNFHGNTMLHMAVVKSAHRSVAFIRSLVDAGTPINTQNSDGQTALHVAATAASSPVVALLCECGADVELKDENGFTPVTWA